ncbi:cytochrome P450 [Xylariaceae sp. FL0255]|nr:cytochrome P450 [Xylariaceae sp. FL0255]
MLSEVYQSLPVSVVTGLGLASLLLCWRFWTFTIKPSLWPDNPVELPRHSFAFFKHADTIIEQGLNYIGRTHEPFALQLLGRKMYIITGPKDVTSAFSNSTSLTFDGNLRQLLTNFGLTKPGFKKAWHNPQPGDWCYMPNNSINPNQLNLIHFVEEILKKQLLPGEQMDKLSEAYMSPLLQTFHYTQLDSYLDRSPRPSVMRNEITQKIRMTTLYPLCQYPIIEAVTLAFFGPRIFEIEPSIVDCMLRFNENAWMVAFGYPRMLSTPINGVRRKVMDALIKYLHLPEDQRAQQAWSIKNILGCMEIVDCNDESRAYMLLMTYWAAISNQSNTVFWIMSYLLYDPTLFRLYLCVNCPQLESMLSEILRIMNGAGALRVVEEKTELGGKVLHLGNIIFIPFRQLHTNEKVWGPTVGEFDPYRFLKKKSLTRHSSYRPFGGGGTPCPGKTLAREQVFGFISTLLHRFDIELAGPATAESFPLLNRLTPSLGVNGPAKGMEVMVQLSDRTPLI